MDASHRGGGLLLVALCAGAACKLDERVLAIGDAAGEGAGAKAIVLGSFEDGTLAPADPRFLAWTFTLDEFGAPPPADSFAHATVVAPGYRDGHALQLSWQVSDVPDGQLNHPGAALSTRTGADLSGYSAIVLAARYQHEGACRAVPLLTVILGCGGYATAFQSFVNMTTDWTAFVLRFADLQEASPVGVLRALCLKAIDAVTLRAAVNLSDGECASGTLWLDDIGIQ